MFGASGGEGVSPFRKVRSEEGASKSKVYNAGAPNERHGNRVKTPGTLRRLNPSSVALSK